MKICFATNNPNKIKEVALLLGGDFQLLGLKDIECNEELREDQSTLEGNAQQKAAYVFENYNIECFADDTGLEVESLNNEPGVFSARYAGPQRSDEDNMALLLERLNSSSSRNARFRTVICAFINNKKHFFEGIVEGEITKEHSGDKGFGYDPIFIPKGYTQTFAQMSTEEKNKISHRSIAVRKLVDFLKTNS
ncbi:non-canonical purine NTP pyrophosphatase [Marivirga tractuosa]|uniref:dITP/XTP pyrophosphatase n=1 Tax=Marivirga tractuosa (strain ATCC 23168 / DSM 4126 / NBRC 15989 / NCIMB 1408 / VKM B-1430 / H-43) TaxID=643867 RepID=E4TNU8_MARTH|nr:non-canonical purine NTP diphosphatase [Marivirga tractuosa]ADR22512.1 non-canonical purine NTP pyrophosphatase, rdgB/HAM1 family [Marivirga tractuosa DSM 4126]BDD16817.1 non-canonical purine NTP pyrophosphatase [Marivirga tractuosa]